MNKYRKIKFHSLGAAAVDDEEELDLGDIELEDDDSLDDSDEELEDEDEDEEPEEGDDEEESDGDEPAPKSSRAQERIRKLAKARRESEAKNLELQQELDRLRSTNNQPKQQQNDPQAIQAWLNSLKPEERPLAQLQLQMQQHQQAMQVTQFNMQDTADKSAFDAKAVNNPIYRKYATKVEQKLQELRSQQGLNAPREEVLKHMVGELVLNSKKKAVTKDKADKSVKKHTVKPTGKGKSDINTGSRKGKTPRERLEGVTF